MRTRLSSASMSSTDASGNVNPATASVIGRGVLLEGSGSLTVVTESAKLVSCLKLGLLF